MTQEQFDSTRWHKGMRAIFDGKPCRIVEVDFETSGVVLTDVPEGQAVWAWQVFTARYDQIEIITPPAPGDRVIVDGLVTCLIISVDLGKRTAYVEAIGPDGESKGFGREIGFEFIEPAGK